ncbi:MAG: 2-hydroxyacid dehydrogenase [Spirochaetia bacterium]|nr:2-hydroxyacid dehydrogenase [Spirochaetia bacterium]
MEKKKVAFFDAKPYDMEIFDKVNRKYGYDIKYFPPRLNALTAYMAKGHDAVCAFVNDKLDADVLDYFYREGIKIVALRSAGYNNVDLKKAYLKVHVARVPAYSPNAVAEHTVALMLSLNRKVHRAYYRTRDNNFSINGFLGFDMAGRTAGVVGTGKIGRTVIGILKGFGMNILAYDSFPDKKYAKQAGIKYAGLENLFRESDIITLHCPLNKETDHLINDAAIKKMKKGVMIINTGRGRLIDTRALIRGLKTNRIGYAGLDVYEEEDKYFFEDFSGQIMNDDTLARLLTFNNVLVTSHQAFFTGEAITNIAETTMCNLDDYFHGRPLKNEICYQCGEKNCRKDKRGRCF